MEGERSSTQYFRIHLTKRVQHIIFQNLLLFLSLNIYANTNSKLQQNQLRINTTSYFPIPISPTSTLMNLAAISAPSMVNSRVFASAVTPTERRQHVVWFAESHTNWGLHYSLGSSSLDDGFDCSGFVRYVLNYFDVKSSRSSSEQFKEGTQIPVAMARPGDLVFFGTKNSVSHVAMVFSNDERGLVVVHSTCSRGIVKENITESGYWKPKLKDKAVNIIGL